MPVSKAFIFACLHMMCTIAAVAIMDRMVVIKRKTSIILWIFLILFVLILEGYVLQNRIIFDSVDKLLPVSNMAYSCLKKC